MPYHVLVCYSLETAESTELTVGAFLLVKSVESMNYCIIASRDLVGLVSGWQYLD